MVEYEVPIELVLSAKVNTLAIQGFSMYLALTGLVLHKHMAT